jgi:alanine racemase
MRDCAPILVEAGAQWLGVTSVEEAVSARTVCPAADILVMSGIWRGEADAVIDEGLTPIVWEPFHLHLLEEAARRRGSAAHSIPVHLELDTGMSRQGVGTAGPAMEEMLRRFHAESALKLDGIATHFSAPEVLDGAENDEQIRRFAAAIEMIAALGHRPAWVHAGNSATLLRGEHIAPLQRAAGRLGARLLLRPGLALYGYAPRFTDGGVTVPSPGSEAKLGPVLAWKTRVTSLRTIGRGEGAGYNSTFRAVRTTRLALLPMGYADGLNRLLSNCGTVLLRGGHAKIAGRISMDQTILDATDLNAIGIGGVEIGDEVVLIGHQGGESLTAYDLADIAGTIPYEVLCNIAARVPRVVID